ncbi:MAG: hypothetical protein K9I74_12315 [Bacteroidales bacterium]|nr:hypothetical protein [Bacteroidales bacterium]
MGKVGWQILSELEISDNALFLYRFMDYPKFEHLIKTSTLYMAPSSEFKDGIEGHHTFRDHQGWDEQLEVWGLDPKSREVAKQAKGTIASHNRGAVVISCWTMESARDPRLWKEYTRSSESVAIETTVGRLRQALGYDFLIIPVCYLDYNREQIPKKHSLLPFCYKRECYAWEKEVRVIGEIETGKKIGTPRKVPVSLNTLISKVVLHPESHKSFVTSVRSLVREKDPDAIYEVLEL